MKTAILAGLYTVRAVDRIGRIGLRQLTLIIVSDEEIQERHSSALL